jgi:putative membrane protein
MLYVGHSAATLGSRRIGAYAALFALLAAMALLCTRLVVRPAVDWSEGNAWLLAITAASTLATLGHACLTLTVRRGLAFLAIAMAVSLAAEYCGMRWSLPFGFPYSYDPNLQPLLLGRVPLSVPPMWFVLAYTPVVFLRPLRVAPRGRLEPLRLLAKVLLCSLYLVCIDLFMDPLGVSVGAWAWPEGGAYLGIPLLNYLGWLAVGIVIFLPYFALAGDTASARDTAALDSGYAITSICLTFLIMATCMVRLGTWLPAALVLPLLLPLWMYRQGRVSVTKPCRRAAPRITYDAMEALSE